MNSIVALHCADLRVASGREVLAGVPAFSHLPTISRLKSGLLQEATHSRVNAGRNRRCISRSDSGAILSSAADLGEPASPQPNGQGYRNVLEGARRARRAPGGHPDTLRMLRDAR